jgi:hypothetical protein
VVCALCRCRYERQSRRRAAELDELNSPLEPLLRPSKSAAAKLSTVDEAQRGGDEAAAAGSEAVCGRCDGGGAAASARPSQSSKALGRSLGNSGLGDGPMAASLQRAMMRTSVSLPTLHVPRKPHQPLPAPSKPRGGANSRIARFAAVS